MIPKTVTIHAKQGDWRDAPVWAALPQPVKNGEMWLVERGTQIMAQVVSLDRQSYLVWLQTLSKGQRKTWNLAEKSRGTSPSTIAVLQTDQAVEFRIGDQTVATFVLKGAQKPYIYPLLGANNKPITRHFPMKAVSGETIDHPHHRSMWFTHGEVNGIDFWTEGANRGRIVHRQTETLHGGPVLARLVTINDWMTPEGKKVLEDTTEFRLYNTTDGRLIEYEIELRATEGDVLLGDTKEGTFGIRVASSMEVTRKAGGQIVNARGQRDQATWGKAAEWCDYTGPVEGDVVGIAIYDHPQNLRHPTTWHVRDYGLFAVNPFGLHDFSPGVPDGTGDYTVKKGDSLKFRYRVWLHKGRTEEAGVSERFDSYRLTPEISWK